MLKKILVIVSIGIFSLFSAYAEEEGYFNIKNGSEYLGFSNMNKEFGITSLMNSAIADDFKAAKIFIASGDDLTQKNLAGATALHLAARNNSYEVSQILIQNGANVNAKDNEGWTPLMRASLAGDIKIVKLLMDNGANASSQNNYNETALVHAAMSNCYECGKIILESSKNINDYYSQKTQINKSLNIVKKRYNEPFIELLSKYNNSQYNVENIEQSDFETDNNIRKLIYVFTGKTVSKEQINKMGKESYIYSLKKQEKLNRNNNVIVLDMDEENINKTTYKNFNTRNIKSNFKNPIINKKIYEFNGEEKPLNQFEKENIEYSDTNKQKFILNPNLSKPIIEEESNKKQFTVIKNKAKYTLNPNLIEPAVEELSQSNEINKKKFVIKEEKKNNNSKYKIISPNKQNNNIKYKIDSKKPHNSEKELKFNLNKKSIQTNYILQKDLKDLKN